MKLEHEVLLYLCPPIGGLSIVDHALNAGDATRLVKWLRSTVKQKQAKGEDIPNDVINWIDSIDWINTIISNENVRQSLCEWRERMRRVNRHTQDELSVLTDLEWEHIGNWLDSLPELES